MINIDNFLELKSKYLSKVSVGCAILLTLVQFNTSAVETHFELHKISDSGTSGYSVGVSDNFFKQKAFNWQISYNQLQDVNVEWNNQDWDLSISTVDMLLTYQYSPSSSYNKFMNKFTFELLAGASVSLTENKLVFEDNQLDYEKIYSEQGDINPVVAFEIAYKTSKSTSIHIGVKHYPNYSEFESISSVYIGFNYLFGSNIQH